VKKNNLFLKYEAIKSFIGQKADFSIYNRKANTPLNAFMDYILGEYNIKEIDLFTGRTNFPQLFILSDFDVPCIYFDFSFIGLSSSIISAAYSFKNEEVNSKMIYQLNLRYISDLLISEGNIKLALEALMESSKSSFRVNYDYSIMDLEMMEYGEAYVAIWFYFISHELGHFSKEINQIVEIYEDALIESNLDDLRNEIISDLIGVQIILEFANYFLVGSLKRESVNYFELIYHILNLYTGLRLISSAKLSATIAVNYSTQRVDDRTLSHEQMWFGTRFCFVMNFLCGIFPNDITKITEMANYMDNYFQNVVYRSMIMGQEFLVNTLTRETEIDSKEILLEYENWQSNFLNKSENNRFLKLCQQFNVKNDLLSEIMKLGDAQGSV